MKQPRLVQVRDLALSASAPGAVSAAVAIGPSHSPFGSSKITDGAGSVVTWGLAGPTVTAGVSGVGHRAATARAVMMFSTSI